jgi:hypothetical protein
VAGERAVAGEFLVRIFDRGVEPEWHRDHRYFGPWQRFEAEISNYAVVNERGASPWEAVHRLVANHRAVLERRWAEVDVDQRDRRPDVVFDLGDWRVRETGESVGLACVVLAPASLVGGRPPLDGVSEEMPFDVRELAEWVLERWGEARGLGS